MAVHADADLRARTVVHEFHPAPANGTDGYDVTQLQCAIGHGHDAGATFTPALADAASDTRLLLSRTSDSPCRRRYGEARMAVHARARLEFRAVVYQLHPAAANGAERHRLTRVGGVIGHTCGGAKAAPYLKARITLGSWPSLAEPQSRNYSVTVPPSRVMKSCRASRMHWAPTRGQGPDRKPL